MSEQITITVSSEIYKQIAEQAKQKHTNVSDVINEVVANAFAPRPSAVNPKQEKMLEEIDAYHKMHPQLIKNYLGQYVAIHQGQLIDYDADKDELFFRVQEKFPNEIVLQRQVLEDPEPVLHFRSPRFLR